MGEGGLTGQVERPGQGRAAGGRLHELGLAVTVQVTERGLAGHADRDRIRVVVRRVAVAGVRCASRGHALEDAAVTVEDERGAGHRGDRDPQGSGAVDVGDRGGVAAFLDEVDRLRVTARNRAHPDRPAGQVGATRIVVAVGLDAVGEGAVGTGITFEAGQEHLVGAVAENITDGRGHHQLRIADVVAVRDRVADSLGQLHLDRPAGDGRSVGPEGIDVAVVARHQDAQLAVTLEIAEGRGRPVASHREPATPAARIRGRDGQGVVLVVTVDREAVPQLAAGAPDVDPAAGRGRDDRLGSVAVEIADRDTADRVTGLTQRLDLAVGLGVVALRVVAVDLAQLAGVDREARGLGAVRLNRAYRAVHVSEDQVELALAAEVDEGRGGAHLGADRLRVALDHVLVGP